MTRLEIRESSHVQYDKTKIRETSYWWQGQKQESQVMNDKTRNKRVKS